MIVDEEKIDKILEYRRKRILSKKRPMNIPKLKFYKLIGDKRMISLSLAIPINENLTIKDKLDFFINDGVSIKEFVNKLQEKYKFSEKVRKNIENKISFQIISHVEKVTIRTRMTKLEKMEMNLKQELEKKKEEENSCKVNHYQDRIRKGVGHRRKGKNNSYGSFKKCCFYCGSTILCSEQVCKHCRIPIRLFGENPEKMSKSKKVALGFLNRMITRSDLMKTFGLVSKIDEEDMESILKLLKRIRDLIMSREDFEMDSKQELVRMFEKYAYNYVMMGLGFANEYEFLDNEEDISKERIKVVSERRGKPGRPKKSEIVKKYLKKTVALPVGRPKMTEEEKRLDSLRGKRRGRPPKKKKRSKIGSSGIKIGYSNLSNGYSYEDENIKLEDGTFLGKRSIPSETNIKIEETDDYLEFH